MQNKTIADEKKTFSVFSIALLLCIFLSLNTVNAADKYIKLPLRAYTHTGDKIEVLEFFWYGCSHCYEFEPVIEQWLDDKAEYIEFVRMPAVLGASWMPYARAYYVAQHLDVLDKIHRPLFDAIHKENKRFTDKKSLKYFFEAQGVSADVFDRAYDSKDVQDNVGGGLKEFIRLSGSNPEMWRDIFELNEQNIIKSLASFQLSINNLLELITKTKELPEIFSHSDLLKKELEDIKKYKEDTF